MANTVTSDNGRVDNESKFVLITAIEARNLPVKTRSASVKVEAGNITRKTRKSTSHTSSPSWEDAMQINSQDLSTMISFSLYHRPWGLRKQLLDHVERPITFFDPSKNEAVLPFKSGTSSDKNCLVIRYDAHRDSAARQLLAFKSEAAASLLSPLVPNVGSSSSAIASPLVSVLQSIAPFKDLFDELAKIHPFASAAWGLVSMVYNILEAQQLRDESMVSLYRSMLDTYAMANKDDNLRTNPDFQDTFQDMIKQTMECAIFIKGYTTEGYFSRLMRRDVDAKVNQFQLSFKDLERRFNGELIRKVAVVSIGVYEAIDFIKIQTTLEKLKPTFHLAPRSSCAVGTRLETIQFITTWIVAGNEEVLWLKGLAGVGKSSLMGSIKDLTLAMGEHGRLGAFIRFDRIQMSDPSRVILSLAYKLAEFDDRIGKAIAQAVVNKPNINDRSLSAQFQDYVIDPLESVARLQDNGPIVIIIDGLDECDFGTQRAELLKVLRRGFGSQLSFIRLIIASRPQPDLEHAFCSPSFTSSHIRPYPLDINSPSNNRDIRLYFEKRLDETNDSNIHELFKEHRAIDELSHRACGLFIWASTIWTFIMAYPSRRLEAVLKTPTFPNAEAALNSLYKTALQVIITERGDSDDVKGDIRTVLGAVIVALEPGLTVRATDNLMFGLDQSITRDIVGMLASVVSFDDQDPIRLIHKSFDDFLQDKQRCGDEWYISTTEHRRAITVRCFKHLAEYFGTPSAKDQRESRSDVPSSISYAAGKCFDHLQSLDDTDHHINELVRVFFQNHFLLWLQVVGPGPASRALQYLLTWTNRVGSTAEDRTLRYHAYQFVEQFKDDFKNLPTGIGLSAMPFAPQNSVIKKLYATNSTPKVAGTRDVRITALNNQDQISTFLLSPDASTIVTLTHSRNSHIKVWDTSTLAPVRSSLESIPYPLEHSARGASSGFQATFSPDGSKIAIDFADGTMRLWDCTTATLLLGPVKHASGGSSYGNSSLVFSRDGTKILLGCGVESICGVVHVWDASTGDSLLTLFGHTDSVYTVAFSSDESKIASGSADTTVRIWDVSTGQQLLENLRGHTGPVQDVSFSPDGSQIASGSDDNTIRLWDAATGVSLIHPLSHTDSVYSVRFLARGTQLLSGSQDGLIRLWEVENGTLLETIPTHASQPWSFVLSPDERSFIFPTHGTLQLWDISNLGHTPVPIGTYRGGSASFMFSLDGVKLALRSQPGDICVENALTGVRSIPHFRSNVNCVGFSPDGTRIASGSSGALLQLWDAFTGASLLGPIQCPSRHRHGSHSVDESSAEWNIRAVAFSRDGSQIVSGSSTGALWIISAITGAILLEPRKFEDLNAIISVAFFPDGARIVALSKQNTIGICDASTGELLQRWVYYVDPIASDPSIRSLPHAPAPSFRPLHTPSIRSLRPAPSFQPSNSPSIRSVRPPPSLYSFGCAPHLPRRARSFNLFRDAPTFDSPRRSRSWDSPRRVPRQIVDGEPSSGLSGQMTHSLNPPDLDDSKAFVALSPDASKVIAGLPDRSIRVWDLTSPDQTGSLASEAPIPINVGRTIVVIPEYLKDYRLCMIEKEVVVFSILLRQFFVIDLSPYM